ncbi:MAG: sec-independent protein translocase protein TatA [Candidatus Azotimanducaceae bacterium]|jgi:sec-independent protein translocase protein TatA
MSFGITELVIILVIVLILFGTTKLKSIGNDLGSAIKGFRSAVGEEEEKQTDAATKTEVVAEKKETH